MKFTLPFGEWLPDQPDYANAGSANILNAIPLTEQTYGPFGSLSPYSTNTLALRCQGAYSALDATASVSLFAADQHDLYRLQAGSTGWAAVSKSASPYNCDPAAFWAFAQFGSNVYASNLTDPMQSMSLAGSSFADVTGAPSAKYLAVVKDFLVAGFTNAAAGGGIQPQRVWWSAINGPANWPTPGTAGALQVQSDYQDVAGTQGWLQGIVANLGYADAALFFERAVYRMTYIGAPAIFQFAPAEGTRGTPAPYSITQLGATVYYLGEDGFYAFDGVQSIPIGAQKVDKWFFANVDQGNFQRIQGAVDPINKTVCWAFPMIGSGGAPNAIIGYRTDLGRWFLITRISLEYLMRMLSIGYTLESLSAVYPVLETVPAPLDSRVWTGGKVILGAFDTAHRLSYFTGPTLPATLETTERQINPNGRVMVRSIRPALSGGADALTASVAVRARTSDTPVYGALSPMNEWGDCPQHVSGRHVRALVQFGGGQSWSHAAGVEVEYDPQGAR